MGTCWTDPVGDGIEVTTYIVHVTGFTDCAVMRLNKDGKVTGMVSGRLLDVLTNHLPKIDPDAYVVHDPHRDLFGPAYSSDRRCRTWSQVAAALNGKATVTRAVCEAVHPPWRHQFIVIDDETDKWVLTERATAADANPKRR